MFASGEINDRYSVSTSTMTVVLSVLAYHMWAIREASRHISRGDSMRPELSSCCRSTVGTAITADYRRACIATSSGGSALVREAACRFGSTRAAPLAQASVRSSKFICFFGFFYRPLRNNAGMMVPP